MHAFHIHAETRLTPTLAQRLAELMAAVPEFDSPASADTMLAGIGNARVLLLLCDIDGELAGFKLGYATAATEFYSWLGAVLPQYRQRGLAQAMLAHQERWAANEGFRLIRVKTHNRFGAMLAMLVHNRYQIIALDNSAMATADYKITLQKHLG